MARTKGSYGPRTLEAIRKRGLRLIYAHGYEGMSLRQLAKDVGIQQGSLYNHIATKQDLLFGLMRDHLESILAKSGGALQGLDDPVDRLKAFVAFHLTYHMERKQEVYINNSELRSLEARNYARIMALREQYEGRLIDILKRGRAAGRFKIGCVKVTAFALLAMLTGICTWYDPKGKLAASDLVDIHTTLVLKGVAGG